MYIEFMMLWPMFSVGTAPNSAAAKIYQFTGISQYRTKTSYRNVMYHCTETLLVETCHVLACRFISKTPYVFVMFTANDLFVLVCYPE